MYKDVQTIVGIINKSIKSTVQAYEKVGADWRTAKNVLEQTKAEILEEYEVEECYSCGKIIDKGEKYCSTHCMSCEYLEVI